MQLKQVPAPRPNIHQLHDRRTAERSPLTKHSRARIYYYCVLYYINNIYKFTTNDSQVRATDIIMNSGVVWCALVLVSGCSGENWQWPEGARAATSSNLDSKLAFSQDLQNKITQESIKNENAPFREPLDTDGFYNRPPGVGRYPVRVERLHSYINDGYISKNTKNEHYINMYDGDSMRVCKCLSTPECTPKPNSEVTCGFGKYLCCFKKTPSKNLYAELFDEVDGERPILLPGHEKMARPFPPPPVVEPDSFVGGFNLDQRHTNADITFIDKQPNVLIGPVGPTGVIGLHGNPDLLVGPEGPTGIVGPSPVKEPTRSESAQRGVLVGPGGPTGIIGQGYGRRPVLVGPGGPTGIIGPARGGRRPNVLVGPGGPTGIIGPGVGYGRQRYGVLTGPGGPTGNIGPGRPILTGPDGPTGHIGPQGFFGK